MKRLSLVFLLLLAASGVRADGGDMLFAYRRTAARPTALYDLSGRPVSTPLQASATSLRTGVYVTDGKVIVVR